MKFFPGLAMSAALVCVATAANAQMLAPYDAGKARLVSDVDEPYVGAPPMPVPSAPRYYGYGPDRGYAPDRGGYAPDRGYAPDPRYSAERGYGPDRGYAPPERGYAPDRGYGPGRDYGYAPGPELLPTHEVYAILRENGFSPLGIPRQRGYVFVIAVLDRGGEDGRLMIDGRNGRIIRFVPASQWGQAYDRMSYGRGAADRGPQPAPSSSAAAGTLPAPMAVNGTPRQPAALPPVASRGAVPVPLKPPAVISAKPTVQPAQQAAVNEAKPAEAPAPKAAATVGEAKPENKPVAPSIKPTQDMPAAQGLD
jgi:hypothetical protein